MVRHNNQYNIESTQHKSHLLYVHGVILNNTEYTHTYAVYIRNVYNTTDIHIHYDKIGIQQAVQWIPITSASNLTSQSNNT